MGHYFHQNLVEASGILKGYIGSVLVGEKVSNKGFREPPSLFIPLWAILGQVRPF
jgi:hypothetical protein